MHITEGMESNDNSPISSPSTDSPIGSPITPTSLSLDPPSSPDIAHLDETNENGGKSVVTGTTSGRVFSDVWKHYEKEKVSGKDKAKCKYCSQLLLGDPRQGTSHLKKHLERCPKRKAKDIRQQVLQTNFHKDILPRTHDFDVLSWWKSNKGKFPILHQIARDILAIPVSTVASESAFSTSGRIVGPHRSRLHPKTVEALMCAQNWLLADLRGHLSDGHTHATVFHDSDDENEEVVGD